MSEQLNQARELLRNEGYTCVLLKDSTVYHSFDRGVKPLLAFLDAGTDLRGSCAADKVIGKATAFLYCLLGVREIYAPVVSEAAVEVLARHGILVIWEQKVPFIWNHRRTAGCPMETAVRDIDDAETALGAIRETLRNMK